MSFKDASGNIIAITRKMYDIPNSIPDSEVFNYVSKSIVRKDYESVMACLNNSTTKCVIDSEGKRKIQISYHPIQS